MKDMQSSAYEATGQVHVSAFNSLVLEMQDLDEDLRAAGFMPVPVKEIPDIVKDEIIANHKDLKREILSGDVVVNVTDLKGWRNREGDITYASDYEILQDVRRNHDPVVVTVERVKGRMSSIVKQVVKNLMTRTTIAAGMARGMESTKFKRCVEELASLRGMTTEEMKAEIEKRIASLFVSAAR
jgi:hypothetical protein